MKKITGLFIAALFLAASFGLARPALAQDVTWELLNPTGGFEITQLHAPRLDTLEGKTICEASIVSWQAHRILPAIREGLQAMYPTAKFIPFTEFPQGTHPVDTDETAQLMKEKGCDAVILASAGWGACSTAVGRASGRIEMLGIPVVAVQRNEFVNVTQNAIGGMGFPSEVAMVKFPVSLFLAESDLTPVRESIDLFVDGLTKWQPSVTKTGVVMPPPVTVTGKNYRDALRNMNAMYLMNSWADGLPLMPATEEEVQWILRGTDLPRDSVVGQGKILPRGGIATVEVVAAALAMAGGRPEYLPVLLAAVEAMLDPEQRHQGWQATTCSIFPAVIVNGPVARDIRLNSRWGLMGPNPAYPAGATIGRALRLLQQNVGGAVPGQGTMAQYGGMRYTNAVFAEDEIGLPPGWKPLNEDRFGLAAGLNTVTLYPVSGVDNLLRRGTGKDPAQQEADESLARTAAYIARPNSNGYVGFHEGTPGILILSSVIANQLAENGWTREKIRDFLWENSKTPLAELESQGMIRYTATYNVFDPNNMPDPLPITAKPENFMIIVAGGPHSTHSYWMQGAQGPKVSNVQIKLPAAWADLIAEAEEELGPIPLDN